MPVREIDVVIRGRPGSGVHAAARAAAQAMEAAGASVQLRAPPTAPDAETLRGVRALVRVAAWTPDRVARQVLPPEQTVGGIGLGQAAKIGGGLVLLLMLFGAELRLRFGLRLDMIVTLLAAWAFWRHCVRPSGALAMRGSKPRDNGHTDQWR